MGKNHAQSKAKDNSVIGVLLVIVLILSIILLATSNSFSISPSGDCGTNGSQQINVSTNNCNTTSFDFSSSVGSPSLAGTCASGGTQDGWGWFTATGTSTTVSADPESSNGRNVALLIYSGTCGSLTLVTCVNNDGGTGTETATFATSAASNYFIRVVRMSGSFGSSDNDVCVINNVPPVITGFSPSSGCVGSVITITGTGLSGASSVRIGGTTASIQSNSSTQITATIGNGTTGLVSVTTSGGTANSSGTFTVNPLPLQYTVNGGGSYCAGGAGMPVGLSNSESGIDYQLKLGGSNTGLPVMGTGAALAFGNQTTAGSYTVTATNPVTGCSRNMTGSVTVTVNALTSITTQPSDKIACESTNTSFSLSAAGSGLTYQWQDNSSGSFANISGATASTLNLSNVSLSLDGRQYQCIVNGNCGSETSVVVTLTVNPKPTGGTATPGSQTICSGTSITPINLNTANTLPGTVFNWTRNNNSTISGISSPGSGSPITGTLTSSSTNPATTTFTITPVSGQGCAGTAFNAAILVNPNTNITAHPSAQTKCEGTNATFSVTVTGATLTYQWQENSSGTFLDIPGANSSSLTVNSVSLGMSGTQYRCAVSGGCGSVNSNPALLSVNAVPVVTATSNPANGLVCASGSVTLTATGATTYSWSPGGATTSSINVSPLTTTSYTVTGTSNGCSAPATRTVTVSPGVTIIASASLSSVCEGENVTLAAAGGNTSNYLVNSIPYNAPLGTGTSAVSGDDAMSGSINLPFTFSFYGTSYSNIYICTNGFIQFGSNSNSTSVYGQSLPSGSSPNTIVAGLFSDLNAPSGTITTFTSGSNPNRVFTIHYNNVPFYCSSGSSGCSSNRRGNTNFQIRLYEKSNIIEVHLQSVTNSSTTSGALKTTGIENQNGTSAKVPAGRNGSDGNWTVSTPEAWRFVPNGGTLTYSWSPPTYLTDVNDTNPEAQNMLLSQNYSVTVTDQNGCSATSTTAITVNPLPAVSITPGGVTEFCDGGNVVLSATAGLSFYSWNTVPVQTSQDINVNTAAVYSVTGTDANGCSNTAMQQVTVHDTLPASIVVIGSPNLCTGQTTTDLQAYLGNAVSYTWSTTESGSLITVSTAGSYFVTATDIYGCEHHAAQSITESASPAAPVIAPSGNTILCSDGITTTNVTLQTTNYTSNLNWSTGETTPNITVDYADVFIVTFTDTNGCYSTSNVIVTEVRDYSAAATAIVNNAANNEVCSGSPVTLSVSGGSLAIDADWHWYDGSCGGSSLGSGSPLTIVPTAGGVHNYYVLAQGFCNITPCANGNLQVRTVSPSSVNSLTAPATACDGNTGPVSLNAVTNATYYSWSGPSGTLFNGSAGPVQTLVANATTTFGSLPAGSSGYSICVFAGNACGQSNVFCRWVRGKVSMPGNIQGSVTGCPNTSTLYSVPPVDGADTYTWNVTGNDASLNGSGQTITTSVPNVTVNFAAPFAGATLSVYASLNCGFSSAARTLAISRNPVLPGGINGLSYVCPTGSAVFSVAPVSGAVSYNWSCSVPGANISPSGASANISFPPNIPAGATVCVTAVSACGYSSPQRCKGIASGLPNTPANITGPASGQCGATGVSFTIPPVNSAAYYQWTVSNGNATLVGPTNLSAVTVDFSGSLNSVQLRVSAGNSCGLSGTRSLSITGQPAMPSPITGNTSVCNGSIESYSTMGSPGATSINWTVPAGALILGGQNTPNLLVMWGSNGGTLRVSGSNACGNSPSRNTTINVVCRNAQMEEVISSPLKVYPNPAHDRMNVQLHSLKAERVLIRLINTLGEVAWQNETSLHEGSNLIELNLENMARGVYHLDVEGSSLNARERILLD